MKLITDFSISVSNEKVEKENKDTNIWNRLTYSVKEINSEKLLDLLSEHYAICGVFNKTVGLTQSEKTKVNWVQSNVIPIDLDERRLDYGEFVKRIAKSDVCPNIIHPTANNGIKGNRYRALYIFDAPIVSERLYKAIYRTLTSEIDRITEDTNRDDCGGVVTQSMAPFYCSRDEVFFESIDYCLYDFLKEHNLFSIPNERDRKETYETKGIGSIEKRKAIRCNDKENGKKVPTERIMFPLSIIVSDGTFLSDYWAMGNRDLIGKYNDTFKVIDSTPLPEVSDDASYIPIPNDYTYIRRYWFMETGRNTDSRYSAIRKIKDGDGRRRKLFLNGVIRRLINPSISFENLLYCLVWEMYHYIINDGNKITKQVLFDIAKRAMNEDLIKWEHLRTGTKEKKFFVNPQYCIKYNISKKSAQNIARKDYNDKQIGELYDCSLTLKENLRVMEENGLKVSEKTLKRFKTRNGISKKREKK